AVAEDQSRWPVKPTEAALIAQRSVPGAVVLNVRPLPGGQYVVTLRADNNVLRVTVNAMSGAIN
ncbi:MAG: PepSY domain-containing protein, partial [Aestuariivirga sp.]